MGLFVGAGGVWKEVEGAGFNVGAGGVWKEILNAYVGAGGVWKQFYQSIVVFVQNTTVESETISPTDSDAAFNLLNTGEATSATTEGGSVPEFTWLLSGSAGDYECRYSPTGDTGSLSGSATATWLNLGTTRTWTLTDTASAGVQLEVTGDLEIGNAGENTALVTATLILRAHELP